MNKLTIALLTALALAVPALAQTKEEPKAEAAKKVEIPKNTFFKGLTSSQYLAKARLLGANVVDKDGQELGTVDDLIMSQNGQIEGVVMGVGGGQKQVGVRMSALKVATADGKTTITLAGASKEVLGALAAYQKAGAPGKK
jgi:sporulation protein YlmC with PRC-barrel domain